MALLERPSAAMGKGLLQPIPTIMHDEKVEGAEHDAVTCDWTDEEEHAVV